MGVWIRRFRPAVPSPARTRVRLLCFPYAGGTASYYYAMAEALPKDIELLAIQYPGRQDRFREKCIGDLRVLASRAASEIRDRIHETPFALFGHSMGSVVAFEVACLLEDTGYRAENLFASGRYAPSFAPSENHDPFHEMSDHSLFTALLQDSRSRSKILRELLQHEDYVKLILPSIRADYQAIETYEYAPRPPLSCPISVLIGEDDPHVAGQTARTWAEHTAVDCNVHIFPGDHFYLDDQAVLTDVAKLIAETI
jgi:pyochelin biosynthesis protein PchC